MITRNIVEKLFKELEELDNKYNNISNTSIFELAIYLYIRYKKGISRVIILKSKNRGKKWHIRHFTTNIVHRLSKK